MEEFTAQIVLRMEDSGKSTYYITLPNDQKYLTTEEITMILAGAVSMLIKTEKGGTDHKLLKKVIDALTEDFVDGTSFRDATRIEPKKKGNEDT